MSEKPNKSLSDLANDAESSITETNQLLETLLPELNESDSLSIDDTDALRIIQLVLQYRLDAHSALRQLSCLQKSLLQLLGIEPLNSFELNIDRMAFALGSDDLHQILSVLNQLVDSLLHIIAQNAHHQSLNRKKAQEHLKNTKSVQVLVKAISKQKIFINKISELSLVLENIEGAPQQGIIHDHIAALKGPVSRFFQAMQHGLTLTASLYQQVHQKSQTSQYLADILEKAHQVLHQMSPELQPQRLFTPVLNSASQSLEERAEKRRMSQFFSH